VLVEVHGQLEAPKHPDVSFNRRLCGPQSNVMLTSGFCARWSVATLSLLSTFVLQIIVANSQESDPYYFSRKSLIFDSSWQLLYGRTLGKTEIKHCIIICLVDFVIGSGTAQSAVDLNSTLDQQGLNILSCLQERIDYLFLKPV